jgi:hypothetical protein
LLLLLLLQHGRPNVSKIQHQSKICQEIPFRLEANYH